MDKLIALREKQLIKIITGVRRCGKSTLMEMFQEYLINDGVEKEQIISINFEDYDFKELKNPDKLYEYIKDKIVSDKMNYLFFDEIQHVENFPEVIDSLYIKKNIDIYMTGSNAYMLSSELATLISGRYVEISMLPLSFKEFLQGLGNENELQTKYKQYVQTSSFPYALALQNYPNELRDYLSGIYNTIVIKDVISRKGITDPMILESILQFLFDNMGNPLSTKKIADTMTSGGRKIDVKTVEKYLSALVEAYIVYQVKRYNIKGKQYLKTLDKYYVVDIGLRNMLLGSRSFDVGHVLENIVFLELKRRGFEVYIGKFDDLEVDFVAMNENGRTYYQVAATVRDQGTLKRELASLQKISDHYPKYILTLDEDPDADYEGIKRINVLSWLLDIA